MKLELPIALVVTTSLSKIAFLRKCLENSYHIVECEENNAALEHLNNIAIDLVIIDEKGLDASSLSLCQKVRQLNDYSAIPLFLMTSQMKKKFIQQALSAGVTDFINEPLDKWEIEQRIAVATNYQRLRARASRKNISSKGKME